MYCSRLKFINEQMALNRRNLAHPQRLDVAVKYMFVHQYSSQDSTNQSYEDLYEKHIYERTGGYEPDGSKKSIKEYKQEFKNLIESISNDGYIDDPIPVSAETGLVLDGAHRLACCLYFDEEPKLKQVDGEKGLTWNYEWFVENGFSQSELNAIVKTHCDIVDYEVTSFLLWSPAKGKWDEIESYIDDNLNILMSRDLSFEEENFPAIINDVYSYESGIEPGPNINEKVDDIIEYGPEFRLILATDFQAKNSSSLWEKAQEIKQEIRTRYNDISQQTNHDYTILHCTDEPAHSKHVITTLLNENNLRMLSLREGDKLRPQFREWLEEYRQALDDEGIDVENTCIVGSSVLEILGIRKSTDIDFIVDEDTRYAKFDSGATSLSENVDLANSGYHKTTNETDEISDNEVIYNTDHHFRYRGLKFAAPNIVRDSKTAVAREKDIKDVHLMDEYLSALDANQRQAHGWDLPAWKIKVLTLTPRWDLMVRKKISRTKSRAFGWAGRNFPEPVKKFLKKFI